MPPLRSLAADYLAQLSMIAIGVLLVALYLSMFRDPPYPALVPVAFWFFYLAYLAWRWILQSLSRKRSGWHQPIALGLAAALTITLYLAGHVGEQQRQANIQQRQLTD